MRIYNLNLRKITFEMEEKIFMVRVAEQAERFEDMFNFLKDVI